MSEPEFRCPRCTSRHSRLKDGKRVCSLCDDPDVELIGVRFMRALSDQPLEDPAHSERIAWPCPRGAACPCPWCHRTGVVKCGAPECN